MTGIYILLVFLYAFVSITTYSCCVTAAREDELMKKAYAMKIK